MDRRDCNLGGRATVIAAWSACAGSLRIPSLRWI